MFISFPLKLHTSVLTGRNESKWKFSEDEGMKRSLFGVSSLSVSLHGKLVCSSNKDLSKQFWMNNIVLVLCVITPTHN